MFLAGGAGSGKGFSLTHFMEKDKFKVIDVDEFKLSFLKLAEFHGKYPELKGLNLKNPQDVFKLHMWVKRHNIKNGVIGNILDAAKNPNTLPNIIFDTTFKDLGDIWEYVPWLRSIGYQKTDIHLTWVLANYDQAIVNNRSRDRVVPDDVVLQTHEGAALTMSRIIKGRVPRGIDGEIRVILAGKAHTQFKTDPDGNAIKRASQLMKGKPVSGIIERFKYVTLKKSGKPIDTESFRDQIQKWIEGNIPRTSLTKRLWRKTEPGQGNAKEVIKQAAS